MISAASSRRLSGQRLSRSWMAGLGFAWLLLGGVLNAQEPVDTRPTVARPAPPAAGQPPAPLPDSQRMVSLALYFAVLVGLAGAGLYLLRNGLPLRSLRSGDARKLQIVEMRALGNRQFLLVVEYEQNRMLLGVTPGKIDYLCPLEAAGSSRFEAPPEPLGVS